jgi:hypothetical protein
MTVGELKAILSRVDERRDSEPVSVLLALPSIGPRAHSHVKHAAMGHDWDRGLLLTAETSLVPKNDKQSIFESAYEFLLWLATKPVKKESYEVRTAKRIVGKYGVTEERLGELRNIFHREA